MTAAIEEALRELGVESVQARLLAETGVVVFQNAYARWLGSGTPFPEAVRAATAALREAVGEKSPAS